MSSRISLALVTLLFALAGCGRNGNSAAQLIRAAEGGTIALADGTVLTIPPGALQRDTTIQIASVWGPGPQGLRLGALVLEPAGLVFATPATVRFPLPADWDPESAPVVYHTPGADPADALPTGEVANVVGTFGAYFSEHPVHHFSCTVAAQNCHAGTIKYIVNTLEARGISHASLLATVNGCYPGVRIDESDCGSAGPREVQALLDTYFDDRGGFDPGVAMPADVLAEAMQAARDGRLVVLAFTNAPWPARAGVHRFYPPGRYAHTATLRVEGGEVVIHNTIMNDNQRLRAHFGGEVTATWPAERLEEFRGLQVGVALELQLCGAPDCLSAPERNALGLNVYAPLNGINSWFSGSSVAPRPVAWPGVRLYVERPAGSAPGGASCQPAQGCPGTNLVFTGDWGGPGATLHLWEESGKTFLQIDRADQTSVGISQVTGFFAKPLRAGETYAVAIAAGGCPDENTCASATGICPADEFTPEPHGAAMGPGNVSVTLSADCYSVTAAASGACRAGDYSAAFSGTLR